MSLNKTLTTGKPGYGAVRFRTNTAENNHLVIGIKEPRHTNDHPYMEADLGITEVAALHAILGNWLKKRDRRRATQERRAIDRGETGRRHGIGAPDYDNGGRRLAREWGRRKGDAR